MPLMLLSLHLLAYVVFAAVFCAVLFYHVASGGSRSVNSRALSFGLLASPLGLLLPYAMFFGLRAWSSGGHLSISPGGLLDSMLAGLLLFGPFVGPFFVALAVSLWYFLRHGV